MGIQKIFLGTTTGDKTGDGAKAAGQKINANFDYLEAKIDNVDKLVSETGFSLAGQNLTMNTGWQWLINGIPYTNPAAVVIPIPFAATGMQRIDLIVLNTSNTFTRIPGTESVSNPVAQPVPNDTVQATLVVVTDGVIEQPTAPVTGDAYIAKSECGFTKLSGSGAKAQFSILSESTNVRVISASSIASIAISDKKYIYPGKDHYVKNETGTTLIIKHNSGTGNYKYLFPNATDLVIPNNQIVHFKFRFDTGNNGFLDYVGGAGSVQLPIAITDVSGLTAELAAKVVKVTGYSLTKNDLTDLLKTAYDNAVSWISSHGNVDNTSDINKPVSTLQSAADATVLADGKTYADGLITQIINGAPTDANTLKELNDKIIAVQAIIGGTTADGDVLVNTVAELLAVFATFPEGVDLVALLAGKVNTTDVYNALDCIVAGKVADARQLKVLNDLITTLRADVTANTTAIGLRELSSNKSQDIETDKASTTKYGSVKAFYDWCVGRFQQKLVAGANIVIDNTNPLAPVISASSGGATAPDASTTVKGIVKLAGDLAGTSALPTVPALANKVDKPTVYKSVAHLGNSLTIHEVTSFWWGTWGMAATIRDNDYVHRFESILKGYYPSLISTPLSIKPWELNYATYDKSLMDASLVGKDLVIMRLGENVTYYADFQNQYKILIQYIQSKVPTARIILGGQFWAESTKEAAMVAVGVELGLTYVNLNYLDVTANKSSIGTMVYGDDLAWHAIDNSGVAAHPNDTGMLKIAETLFSALGYKNSTITQVTPVTLIVGSWGLVSGIYEYNLVNTNITPTSMVEIIPDNSSISVIKIAEVLPKIISGNGTVKLYSTNLPSANITVTLNIFK